MTSTTRNRLGNFGSASGMINGDKARASHGSSIGPGFGGAGGGWNGGIWGTTIGSGLKSGSNDNPRTQDDTSASSGGIEAISGSGSLLPSSESDNWNGRHTTPWKSIDDTSPAISSVHTNHSGNSPMRRQPSNQLVPQSVAEAGSANSSYFSIPTSTVMNQGFASKTVQKHFLDPTSGSFQTSSVFDSTTLSRSSRQNSEESNRRPPKAVPICNNENTRPSLHPDRQYYYNNVSGYNSSAASRSGSLPPSRNGVGQPSRFDEDMPNLQYSQFGPISTNSHRPHGSSHSASYSMHSNAHGQKYGDPPSPTKLGVLTEDFGKMNVGRGNLDTSYAIAKEAVYSGQTPSNYGYTQRSGANSVSDVWGQEDNTYQGSLDLLGPDAITAGSMVQHSQYRSMPSGPHYSHSPSNSDARPSQPSPYYQTGETSPSGYHHRVPSRGSLRGNPPTSQAALLDHKLRGIQQEQQGYAATQPNPFHFRPPFPQAYDFHPQSALRINPLAPYCPIPSAPNLMKNPPVPRGPAREQDPGQHLRSPLLEEFRNNSKTNKRYELKDIYHHIVEFSGDQHGSRFIQQKLETANSDEKDQVFCEIRPNSIQLMTDVFGNYVIQKFFEHGSQSQKKILANQMKNHILTLSLQMYGCRVVQKALEHILTDQQAQLVKELENHILKCVKDQNGNHVVQKAIERVPAEHIQFIINAFTGAVQGLATHPYGCRVIQRMLEHCEEPTRTTVLQELHACAPSLIVDQYGNYVTQHVIEHGKPEDRAKIINLVTAQLVNFSKHKFASNVVEKSIQFGNTEQRKKIIATLTVLNDKGESPISTLIRDQYGNYVIQKLLTQLKETEYDELVELIKPQLALLKRFSYGKQIAAIEKVVYTNPLPHPQRQPNHLLPAPIDTSAAPTPPLLTGDAQSPQSSSLPSTNASSIGGHADSRKSSASNAVEVLTPTST